MRELHGYKEIKMVEFHHEDLSAVLSEVALYVAKLEDKVPEFHLKHEWHEDIGNVIYLYVQYS